MVGVQIMQRNAERSDLVGAPGRDRTCGTRIRNPVLYPLSYGGKEKLIVFISVGYRISPFVGF